MPLMTWRGASARRRRFQPVCREGQLGKTVERERERGRTLEGEEDEESELVLLLLGVVDLAEEAEVVIAPQSVPILRHDVGEGVYQGEEGQLRHSLAARLQLTRNVSRLDDSPRLAGFPRQEQEREDDASGEDPFSLGERRRVSEPNDPRERAAWRSRWRRGPRAH